MNWNGKSIGFSPWLAAAGVLLSFALLGGPEPGTADDRPTAEDLRWTEMVSVLDREIDAYDGRVGVYIKDLRTGKTYERNADKPFVSASLIKVPVMAATLRAVRDGLLTLDTPLRIHRTHKRGGSGRLKWARNGTRMRVSRLLYEMITGSDNTATAVLIDRLGYAYLNAAFEEFDLYVTRINPKGMSLADHILASEDNYTTAREMGALLEKIHRHQLVSDGFSDLMVETMKGANRHTRLAQYLPPQWEFARKTGLLRRNCHDVGLLYADGSEYVICVLTGENDTYRKAKGFISSLGRTAYSFLGHS